MGNVQTYDLRSAEFKAVIAGFADIIQHYKSLPSESASPSELLILTFRPNVTYGGVRISNAFLKIFLNPALSNISTRQFLWDSVAAQAGLYEFKVYRDRIKPLVDTGVCPFFVNFLGGHENFTFAELKQILQRQAVSDEQIIRNLVYLYEGLENRPAVTEPYPGTEQWETDVDFRDLMGHIDSMKNSMFFVFSMLETIDTTKAITFSEEINSIPNTVLRVPESIWSIIFQIVVACHALWLSKVTHNDLHYNNVWVQTLPSTKTYVVQVEDAFFTLTTSKKVKLFDFDRAYSYAHGNNPINDRVCIRNSQCNRNVAQLDIVKILCYVYKTFRDDDILSVFIPPNNDALKNYWKDVYSTNCFLRHGTYSVPEDEYTKLLQIDSIIRNIADRCPQFVSLGINTRIETKNLFIVHNAVFDNIGNIKLNILQRKISHAIAKQRIEGAEEQRFEAMEEVRIANQESQQARQEVQNAKQTIHELQNKLLECEQKLNTQQPEKRRKKTLLKNKQLFDALQNENLNLIQQLVEEGAEISEARILADNNKYIYGINVPFANNNRDIIKYILEKLDLQGILLTIKKIPDYVVDAIYYSSVKTNSKRDEALQDEINYFLTQGNEILSTEQMKQFASE